MFLVTGATGNVGAEVVRTLIDAGEPVRALTRSDRADAVPAGAEAVDGDLNRPDSLVPALAGVRGVFLLPGYADMDGVLAAVARGGRRARRAAVGQLGRQPATRATRSRPT